MKHVHTLAFIAALPFALGVASSPQASSYPDDFLKWKEQTMSSYQAYKDERDKAFTDFLKKQWKEVDTQEGVVRDTEPKPVDMPVAKPKPIVVDDLPVVQIPKKIVPVLPEPEHPIASIPEPTTPIIDVKPDFDMPRAEVPRTDKPRTDKPRTDKPRAEVPRADKPQIDKPPFSEPDFDQITKTDPVFDQPDFDQPDFDQDIKPEMPRTDKPRADKPQDEWPQAELPEPIDVEPPKDITLPEATPEITPPVPTPEADITPRIPPLALPVEPKTPDYSGKTYRFDFFGRETVIIADKKLAVSISRDYGAKAIAKGWSDLSLSEYEPVLEQLNTISKQYNLGDWGKVQLAFAFSKAMHPGDINAQSFTSWFLLVKQDYQARLAYNKQGVYLLVPAQQSLYEVTFFTFGGKRFYAVSPDGKARDLGRVFTYDGEYPRAITPVNMKDPLAFSDEKHYQRRDFKFKYDAKEYRLSLNVNPTRINYLASYPQMDIDQYFISPVDAVTANDALDLFRPMLEGKSELEAVNLLLRFVQTGFKYQTDDQQFGFENYLFAEETLTMPASDCEDRSVLFAWLVRELLGLEVVGLDYPGHIAAAVAFSKPISGDSIAFNGKKFTVTDPTYINATAGMTMPEVAGHQPKVVAIQ